MRNAAKSFVICCAVACCSIWVRADDAPDSDSAAPCCGREAAKAPPSISTLDQKRASGTIDSDRSNCVCLKYIYANWGDGSCSFYATDCFWSPFSWNDFCDSPTGNCDANSCGTCFYFPQMPAPRAGRHDRPVSALADHTTQPRLTEESGATFFEDPFFVRIKLPGREERLVAKVFPILVPRKEVDGRVLPAQVFYAGIEVDGLPAETAARPIRGEVLGAYGCRAVDYERVLQIRTHTRLTD